MRKFLASAAIVGALAAGVLAGQGQPTVAGGETRTITLFHTHTKERLNVTYMVNGRYVPSAMRQINYLLRDWRKNKTVKIDPKTIDLMWELHADLGSKAPIHIICGYRSAGTNKFLRRIGRKVAKHSQHVRGKAIDLRFPDVSTLKVRNSALVRRVGGVGYYTGRNGFIHIDSGNVRHWGPGISQRQMAQIFRDYRKTVGARRNGKDMKILPGTDMPEPEMTPIEVAKAADEEGDNQDIAEAGVKAKPADDQVDEDVTIASNTPIPRAKPIEVLALAAMRIEPASAPPENQAVKPRPSPVKNQIAAVEAAELMVEETPEEAAPDRSSKGNFVKAIGLSKIKLAPPIKPVQASVEGADWADALIFGPDKSDSAKGDMELIPAPKAARQKVASVETNGSAKSDRLVINRKAKTGLPGSLAEILRGKLKIGSLD